MKVTSTKLFEIAQIQDEKIREALQPLVEYINGVNDQLIRLSQKQISILDNISSESYSVTLNSGVEKEILIRNPENILGVLILKVVSNGYTDFAWRITNSGALGVKVGFTTAKASPITFLVLYR